MTLTIQTRNDLSFTSLDRAGRIINWPRNNPGVPGDVEKGMAYFDEEITALAAHNETEAFRAIQFAIAGMGGRYTNLEISFIGCVARAAVVGLRSMRHGG